MAHFKKNCDRFQPAKSSASTDSGSAVGSAVAHDTKGSQFESSHQQNVYVQLTVLKKRK